jgi:microcin C transport system substrate-binding protein
VVDALIDNAVAANDRQSLYFACRALDRVLRSEHYWVAGWFKPSHWIAYWDMFGRPGRQAALRARRARRPWWYDTDKAAKLGG